MVLGVEIFDQPHAACLVIIGLQYPYVALFNRVGGLYGRILTKGGREYRLDAVRFVHTTEVKILPYRPTKLG